MTSTNAQDHLIISHMALAKSIALRYSWTSMTTDDLIQEAYLALTEAARSHNPARGHFATYAYAYIRGSVLKALQRYGYLPRRGDYDTPQFVSLDHTTIQEPEAGGSYDAEASLLEAEAQAANQQALAHLSHRERQVVALYLDGLTVNQIADQLSIAPATAQSLKQQSLAKFEAYFTERC